MAVGVQPGALEQTEEGTPGVYFRIAIVGLWAFITFRDRWVGHDVTCNRLRIASKRLLETSLGKAKSKRAGIQMWLFRSRPWYTTLWQRERPRSRRRS